MAAPGSFTAGSVLTAAEMNDLPAGLLAVSTAFSNYTISATGGDITSVTFTVPAGRRIMLQGVVPAFNQASTTVTITLAITDQAAASSPTTYYNRALLVLAPFYNIESTVTAVTDVFGAGTHTVYLVGYTNTGTAVADGNAGPFFRANTLAVYDVGAA